MEQPTCQIDDLGPLSVIQPQSPAELGDLVRRAAVENQAIYPLGGRTMLHIGLPPTKPGIGVDLRCLDQVIDYPARDMTITVQAGITIAKLQEILRGEGQQLPVDVPLPEQATLGGALAVNSSGPRRYGYGTLRDYVIGITVVNDEGHEVKAGGRVVKNVAGYDLCKLYVGSLGTLGVITQVTLKLRPVPEALACLIAGCASASLADLLDRVHASATRPVCIDVVAPTPIKAEHQVMIGFAGSRPTVDWQASRLQQELQPEFPCLIRHDADAVRDFGLLSEAMNNPTSLLSFKANVLPSALAPFLGSASELSIGYLHAHAGNGIVEGHFVRDLTLERAQSVLSTLQLATATNGNVVVLRCPTAWKKSLPIWGKPRGDAWLMRAVKDKLDPRRIFNPGRFVEGI